MDRTEQALAETLAGVADPDVLPDGATIDDLRRLAAQCLACRVESVVVGGAALAGLRAAGESFRAIHQHTGVPKATAGRWIAAYLRGRGSASVGRVRA